MSTPFELLVRSPSTTAEELEQHIKRRLDEAEVNLGAPLSLFMGPAPESPKRYIIVRVIRSPASEENLDLEAHINLAGQLSLAASECRFSIVALIDGSPVTTMVLRRRYELEIERAMAAAMNP